jgi:hypothetical protein
VQGTGLTTNALFTHYVGGLSLVGSNCHGKCLPRPHTSSLPRREYVDTHSRTVLPGAI